MDTIKNLLSGSSDKDEQKAATSQSDLPHPSGNLTGQGSHFGTSSTTSGTAHMPGSWDEREFEATKGTGISSAIPGAPKSTATSTGPTTSTLHSGPTGTSAAALSGLSSEKQGTSFKNPAISTSSSTVQPTASGEYAGSSAHGVAGQSIAHSAQTTSAVPASLTSSDSPTSTYSQKPTASGEYAGSAAAGVAGQSVPHSAQTTSAAPTLSDPQTKLSSSDNSPVAPKTGSISGEYAGSSAPGVSGQSVPHGATTTSAVPGAVAAGAYAANDSKAATSGQYAGTSAPGVTGQSAPRPQETSSTTPSATASAVSASNTPAGIPDRSKTTGQSGTTAAIGSTYTERAYHLDGGDASSGSPHNTDTVNRIHSDLESAPTASTGGHSDFASGATSTTGTPYTTKVSQPFASDPISTAPLSSNATTAPTSANHKPHDSGIGHSVTGTAQKSSTASNLSHSADHPGTTVGTTSSQGTDPHAYDRNFQDRAGGRDIVESTQIPSTDHHYGRDATIGAGAVGAGGLAAHELGKERDALQTSGSTASGTTSTNLGTSSSGAVNTPSADRAGGISSGSGLGSSATTSTGAGAVPYSVGGVSAAGTDSTYLTQHEKSSTTTPSSQNYGTKYNTLSDGTPSGISTRDPAQSSGLTSTSGSGSASQQTVQQHNATRDAALAGGAVGAAGLGAHEASKSHEKSATTTTSSGAYGDQYDHLADGTPSGISHRDAAHPSQGGLTSAPSNNIQQSQLGRDAALTGGAAGAAGVGAAGLSQGHQEKPTTTTPASANAYGDQYKHLSDGTPSGISVRDGAHPNQGSVKSTTTEASTHHYGRDAALASGAGGVTGLAAHELSQNIGNATSSTGTGASASANAPGGLAYEEAFELGKQHGAADRAAGYQPQGAGAHVANIGTGPTPTSDPSYVGSTHTSSEVPRSTATGTDTGLTSTNRSSTVPEATGHSTEHHPKSTAAAATGAVTGTSVVGNETTHASHDPTQNTATGPVSNTSTTSGNVPSGYPFDSDKIEKAADQAHGREHYDGSHEKRGLLDKILHRDHPNKLHKDADHSQAAKTTHEAYGDLKHGQAASGSNVESAAEHEGKAQGIDLNK